VRRLRLGEEKKKERRKKDEETTAGQKYNGLPYYIGQPLINTLMRKLVVVRT